MEKFELHNKIVQQLRFHRISGLDEEECANNILSLVQTDWTEGCSCYHGDTTGETWCCNKCGKPTSRHSSPSLPSDEEKKKSVINKILDDLPIREVRGEMSPDEWYGWFEEVYDKAFSLCSTRIAEMEREMKAQSSRMMQLENALKDSQILLKNFKSYATDSSAPVYFGGVSLDDALNTNWNLIKSTTTTP